MKVYKSLSEIRKIDNPVVTIGTFDGVHEGHKQIIERLNKAKEEIRGESFIFTFHPHPRQVLFPGQRDLKLLTLTGEKLHLLEKAGIDHVLVYPFTKEFSRLSATDYIKQILVEGIGTKKLIIGYDHKFGNNREGNFEILEKFSAQYNFSVEEIPAHEIEHSNVSSTKIRRALEQGDIQTANKYLGYAYFLSGTVIKGKQLGRQLGYPTANIGDVDGTKLVPGIGVYAVTTILGGKRYKGMMSVGLNPTTDTDNKLKIEVNIFNFDKDIYGKEITVEFCKRLRNEEKFESLEKLKKQLAIDKENALSVL
ncbi:MAG TPA: bifunctional riboflavin kinase/FAD synthetase [Bacteroidia bacterium]|jgi:riboflavin kinase/FMN adenylyltransferase|nr:bifunctional riboflavin kinase/FAD synthetase [Bacteroidia bacterium]